MGKKQLALVAGAAFSAPFAVLARLYLIPKQTVEACPMEKFVLKLVQPFADLVWGARPMQAWLCFDVFRLLKCKLYAVHPLPVLVALVLLVLKLLLPMVVRMPLWV